MIVHYDQLSELEGHRVREIDILLLQLRIVYSHKHPKLFY